MSLKPWREVIVPHEDVLEGTFQEAEFAADLTKVVLGIAPPEYLDPVRFFERTVITEGMSLLLQSVLKRLSGRGGDPVVQLQTAFGGGKTHTMMAVLHVARAEVPAARMLGLPALLDKANAPSLVRANVAVLDGNALSPSLPREHGRIQARTLWGELACQLGRERAEEAYALVAAADRDGTSPGKDALATLFERFGPAVVLLDEAVAYLRQFEPGKSYPGGTYNSNLSFFQALTEAATRVPTAMVLASLPESMMEVGDEHGHRALDALQKYFGRIEAVWKPVATDEAFEIVRRRLFGPVLDELARDDVCKAFAAYYVEHSDRFPSETRDAAYLRRLKASYPIHPEVFGRLYEDWSTLPKFQRTRGVLRLVARLVHSLWRTDNRDLLILPGSVPLDDTNVRNELVKYLPGGWDAIVDKDIDGEKAEPRRLDDATPALGAMQACRRAARTIFLGSAPSVAGQKVRGLGTESVRLGCAQPGQALGRYDDALRRLTDRLHYLYSGNERYWFDLRPNLRREMEDRMQRFDLKLDLYPELQIRLEKVVKSGVLQGVHVFRQSKDIPDKTDLKLVVLEPEYGHKRRESDSRAIKAAQAILERHGDKPREFQNRLLFLAADAGAADTLRDQLRRYLAWNSIVKDANELNLDKHHEKEATRSRDEASGRLEGALRETYKYLLAPMQSVDVRDGLSPVQWEDETLNVSVTADRTYDKALASATREKEWVIQAWAPVHLANILQRWFWKDDKPSAGANRVWLDTCRYLYLPRLASSEVLLATIRDGLKHRDYFGYAGGAKPDGSYTGLLFGDVGGVYLDESSVLVRPDVAQAAQAPGEPEKFEVPSSQRPATGGPAPKSGGYPKPTPSAPILRRFHASAELDPADPINSFAQVVENVIEHFTAQYGTEVVLSLDIEARRSAGFGPDVVRTAKENCVQLRFKNAEFEES